MIPAGVTVKMSKQISFTIPSIWRNKLNIEQGNMATIYILHNSIMIKVCEQFTTEMISTIGKEGQIYIPAEARNYFTMKGIKRFLVFIDEVNRKIILKPVEEKSGTILSLD